MQRLKGLRVCWTRSTGQGLGQERQEQPLHDLEMPSVNLATWNSWNNQTKGFSGSPALHPSASQHRPITESSHTRGALGCFAHQLFCSTLSHQVPFYLPLPARNYSTSSTELFISLRGCHGARHYGSQRPRKHLFAQLPDGFLKNCFPCSAAGNTSHSSATTNWESLFVPEQCCQSPGAWRGQLSAPRTRPRHSEAPGRAAGSAWAGDFPGISSASSLLSYLGLSGSYGSALSQPGPLPARGPRCSQVLPLRARGCDWDFLLLPASSPFTPIYTPAPDAAPTFPGTAFCSPLL